MNQFLTEWLIFDKLEIINFDASWISYVVLLNSLENEETHNIVKHAMGSPNLNYFRNIFNILPVKFCVELVLEIIDREMAPTALIDIDKL